MFIQFFSFSSLTYSPTRSLTYTHPDLILSSTRTSDFPFFILIHLLFYSIAFQTAQHSFTTATTSRTMFGCIVAGRLVRTRASLTVPPFKRGTCRTIYADSTRRYTKENEDTAYNKQQTSKDLPSGPYIHAVVLPTTISTPLFISFDLHEPHGNGQVGCAHRQGNRIQTEQTHSQPIDRLILYGLTMNVNNFDGKNRCRQTCSRWM